MASGERCSRGRAPGRRVRQRPPAVRKVVSRSVAEKRSRRVKWGVSDHARSRRRLERWVRTSCRRRVPDLGQEDHFLARTIRGIAYFEEVEPLAAKVTLELIAFAKAQGRGRSHDLLADGGRSLKGHKGQRDLGHGTCQTAVRRLAWRPGTARDSRSPSLGPRIVGSRRRTSRRNVDMSG